MFQLHNNFTMTFPQILAVLSIIGLLCLPEAQSQTSAIGRAGVIQTYGGSVNGGKPCYFPFLYEGKMYSYCTLANSNLPWCSTQANYLPLRSWGFCGNVDMTRSKSFCFSPKQMNKSLSNSNSD